MLEKLTADDRTGAEALFHEIVVEKSRSIYENLLENDLADIAVEETSTEETPVEEAKKDKKADKEDSKDKEEMKKESTEEVAAETTQEVAPVAVAPVTAEVGGDASDDMIADIEDDKDAEDKGEDKPEAADMEDKIVDLEDAVEELKAEFEKLMSNDSDKDAEDKGEKDEATATEVQTPAEEVTPEVVATTAPIATPIKSEDISDRERMREYVDKVAVKHTDGSDNSKSPVAKQAKGSTQAVDFVGSEEKGRPAPKAEMHDGGNVNTPGASAKLVKAKVPAAADKADNAKSILGSKK